MSKVSCRKAFSARLTELAREDQSIFVLATDSRGSVTIGGFAAEHPDRFIECGIAEQNAVAIAAGLAKSGKTVFVTGPACFLAARAFEQVKIDVAYNKTNVKVIGVSSGVSYGPLGGTHTSTHDYAGMRALPNLTVLAPSDNVQAASLTEYLVRTNGPAYMRMGRGDVEGIYRDGEQFNVGVAKEVNKGSDITIIACGETVWHALQAAEGERRYFGPCARHVYTNPSMRPRFAGRSRSPGHHHPRGTQPVRRLRQAVAHIVVTSATPVPMRIIGFPDEELLVGRSAELFAHYGLSADNVVAAAKDLLEV